MNFLYQLQLSPEPLTRGLPHPDPRFLCPLSSTEFVEPPPPQTKFLGTPLPGLSLSPCPLFFTWLTVFSALDSLSFSQDGSTFLPNCCPLLKRLQLTAAAWVKSLSIRDDSQGKHADALLLFDLSTGRHLLAVSLVTSLYKIYARL